MNAKKYLAIIMAGSLIGAPLVYATDLTTDDDSETKNIQANLAQTTVSLTTAISSAEALVNGKAVSAELDEESGKAAYQIEVLNGDKLTDVIVDGRTGQIVSSKADQPDHEDEDDQDNDES